MNFDTVTALVNSMAAMKYFPSDDHARLALVELMGDLTDDEEKVRWLVKRMRTLYAEWPGEREVRATFCSKYKPKDGINAYSSVYEDGIPSEREQQHPQIAGPELRALPPGHAVSADPKLEEAVRGLAEVKRIPPARIDRNDRVAKRLEEILTPPQARPVSQPTPQVISQADIDKAVAEHRAASHQQGDESGVAASPEREGIGARHDQER